MKMESRIRNRIILNAFISLLIYALPVLLMFLSFYVTGQRPWEKNGKDSRPKPVYQRY